MNGERPARDKSRCRCRREVLFVSQESMNVRVETVSTKNSRKVERRGGNFNIFVWLNYVALGVGFVQLRLRSTQRNHRAVVALPHNDMCYTASNF